ncbi:hypothetical protein [Arthrobacter rhizosphaerae]|uniref:hypothetical protein n=1 Tax=Arthrobacter rhizosphaerae TaxID=2855490 RepID=UPI001FF2FEF0|nr:hypothetical protein [Arthrobacter rhizosphaerae]
MNTFGFRALGASAVLVVGLAGCGAPAAEKPAKSNEGASAAPVESVTPTPTPTPEAKSYTSDELTALVGQLKDSKGVKLSVMSMADLSESVEQTKALMSSIAVEPAECKEMALAGAATSFDDVTAATGSSVDATSGATTMVSMMSSLDPAILEGRVAKAGEVSNCSNMSFTVGAMTAEATVAVIDGVGSVPGTIAKETHTSMSTGQKQDMIMAQAVTGGVLITVMSSGGTTREEAVSRAGAMMDQAAALLK